MNSSTRIDVMIVGAEKAGTSSLGNYLSQHPAIVSHLPDILEFPYFLSPSYTEGAYLKEFKKYFPAKPNEHQMVLGKCVDLMFVDGAAARLHTHNSKCKIIVSLRNPIDRAYSSYWYQRFRGAEESLTFEEALEKERKEADMGSKKEFRSYVARGLYYDQLMTIVNIFGLDNVHVVIFEHMKENPLCVIKNIVKYLGLPEHGTLNLRPINRAKAVKYPAVAQFMYKDTLIKRIWKILMPFVVRRRIRCFIAERNINKAVIIPPMRVTTREMLNDIFALQIRELHTLLNVDLSIWK
jgi:hypothetical protein